LFLTLYCLAGPARVLWALNTFISISISSNNSRLHNCGTRYSTA